MGIGDRIRNWLNPQPYQAQPQVRRIGDAKPGESIPEIDKNLVVADASAGDIEFSSKVPAGIYESLGLQVNITAIGTGASSKNNEDAVKKLLVKAASNAIVRGSTVAECMQAFDHLNEGKKSLHRQAQASTVVVGNHQIWYDGPFAMPKGSLFEGVLDASVLTTDTITVTLHGLRKRMPRAPPFVVVGLDKDTFTGTNGTLDIPDDTYFDAVIQSSDPAEFLFDKGTQVTVNDFLTPQGAYNDYKNGESASLVTSMHMWRNVGRLHKVGVTNGSSVLTQLTARRIAPVTI
jgi:hypothetical protein